MAAAFFALAGALIGVVGTLVIEMIGARREDRRRRSQTLRQACTEFLTEISRLRDVSHELRGDPTREDLRDDAAEAHVRARAAWAGLQLASESVATQEGGRLLLHYAYWHWRAATGGAVDYDEAQRLGDEWAGKLFLAARHELGLRRAKDVYTEPADGLPVPMLRP